MTPVCVCSHVIHITCCEIYCLSLFNVVHFILYYPYPSVKNWMQLHLIPFSILPTSHPRPSLPPSYPLFLPPTLFFFLLSLPNAQSCCFNLLLPTSLFYPLPCPPTSPLQRSHQLKFHFIMKKTNDSPFIILFYIANRFIIYMFVFTCTFTYTVVAEERDLTKYFR